MSRRRVRFILSDNLKKLLPREGESLVEFADRAATGKTQLYNILRGKGQARIGTIDLICDELGLAPWQLLLPDDVAERLREAGIDPFERSAESDTVEDTRSRELPRKKRRRRF